MGVGGQVAGVVFGQAITFSIAEAVQMAGLGQPGHVAADLAYGTGDGQVLGDLAGIDGGISAMAGEAVDGLEEQLVGGGERWEKKTASGAGPLEVAGLGQADQVTAHLADGALDGQVHDQVVREDPPVGPGAGVGYSPDGF